MSTNSRRVFEQAVALWRNTYAFLASADADTNNRLGDGSHLITIPQNLLSQLYNDTTPPAPGDSITFWMGLENYPDPYPQPNPPTTFPTPTVVVSRATGNSISGSVIYDGAFINSSDPNYSTMEDEIQHWYDFCQKQVNNVYVNDYVHMRLYSYPWAEILTLIPHHFTGSGNDVIHFEAPLSLEIVAHTVGPDNRYFDTVSKDPDHTLEGFIAIDLLLTDQVIQGAQQYHDFVMPCPKFCP